MINVVSGDIGRVEVDAIIAPINSGGAWFGGIDGVIQRAAGGHFHGQAAKQKLKDGVTVVATGTESNKGRFNNVVFVVDDLLRPLSEIIDLGLRAADDAGFKTISLPTVRMGVMAGLRESKDEAIKAIASTAKKFMETAKFVKTINIVVYNDEDTVKALNEALAFGDN